MLAVGFNISIFLFQPRQKGASTFPHSTSKSSIDIYVHAMPNTEKWCFHFWKIGLPNLCSTTSWWSKSCNRWFSCSSNYGTQVPINTWFHILFVFFICMSCSLCYEVSGIKTTYTVSCIYLGVHMLGGIGLVVHISILVLYSGKLSGTQ